MKNLAIILNVIMLTLTLATPSVLAGVDRCLSLDGDGDYVDLGENTFNTLDDFTIEMWVRLNDDKPWQKIFYGGNLDTDNPKIQIRVDPNLMLCFAIVQADGKWSTTQWHIPLGQWFHVAAVFDKDGDGMFLYLNGELVGTNPYNEQSFSDFAEFDLTYFIGDVDGQIDEARIWSIARSQADIQATMDVELEGTEEGLAGYWKFNEAGGAIAYDSSPNGNDGTLVGDAYFARKVFVSPDGSDITGEGTIENPYQTIQTGIFNTPTGGIVMVMPGTYVENFTLASGIIVQGAGVDKTTVTVESGDIVTANNVTNTTISGFTIDGGGNASNGIHCRGATSSTKIVNNVITSTNEAGIRCSDAASPLIGYNTIKQNFKDGIVYSGSSNPKIEYNIICDNRDRGIGGGDTSTANISYNVIERNARGVACWDSSKTKIIHNTLRYNHVGIVPCGGDDSITTINDNMIQNNGCGIDVNVSTSSAIVTISRNIVDKNERGIIIHGTYSNPLIGGSLVNANNIINNNHAVTLSTNNTINATFNYWGTTDENEIAEMMEYWWVPGGIVKFVPFITDVDKMVADASGDGTVSAYDAALILQYVVGLIDTFPISVLESPQRSAPQDYIVSLPDISIGEGKTIQTPIVINDMAGITAGGISLKYDSKVMRAVKVSASELLSGYYWKSNIVLEDEVRIAFAGVSPPKAGQGEMFTVTFEVLPHTEGATTDLILDTVQLSNSLTVTKKNGSITVLPSRTLLMQNYPNPFNPETWIPYQLAEGSDVSIIIYNVKGDLVRILRLGHKDAGSYILKGKAAYWDGMDDFGNRVASGVYFCQLKAGGFKDTRKLVLMK
ncbi:right-handed parallel beta-helix repeat-containing protein [bacterium]|nr:right-handed parallel beta-helix repeat-containing protein [bacterium]